MSFDDTFDGTSRSITTYRSTMSPRVINIQRARNPQFGSGVVTRVFQNIHASGNSFGFGPGLAQLANFPAVPIRGGAGSNNNLALVGLNQVRHKEKRELELLNDKFAQYLEKVRFLEAQNRKLLLEIDSLKSRAGQGSSKIKEMYDIEMAEAHKLIDDTKRDAAAAQVKAQQAEQETKRHRNRLDNLNQHRDVDAKEVEALQRKIAENQAQIGLFRRRMGDLDEEGRRYKAQAQRLASEIARLQNEIQNESLLKSSAEIEKASLEDEIASLRQIHEADLAELRSQMVSNDLDPSQFFRNELSQAIREIRGDFENRSDQQRADAQSRFATLYNELIIKQQRNDANPVQLEQQRRQEERSRKEILGMQNQNGYLRAQNQDIRNRIEDLVRKIKGLKEDGSLAQARIAKEIEETRRRLEIANRDYAEVTNMKTSLEKEITTYRDLLESQNGLRGYVDRIMSAAQQQAIDNGCQTRTGGTSTTITRTSINAIGLPAIALSSFTSPGSSSNSLVNQYRGSPLGYSADMITRRSDN